MSKRQTRKAVKPDSQSVADTARAKDAALPQYQEWTLDDGPERGRADQASGGGPKSYEDTENTWKFDSSPSDVVQYRVLENKKREFVALVVELFGRTPEEAEREYEQRLSHQFQAVSQPEPVAESAKPLCVPDGAPELYQGKAKSGEIYAFLQKVYPFREGAPTLSTGYLQEHDHVALTAFRGRRRSEPVPECLKVLTSDGIPSVMSERLIAHNVDISTPQGIAEAKKLASAITKLVYAR